MDSQTSQLLINACGIIIGLVILQVILQAWDKKSKAKALAEAEAKKAVSKKKK